MSFNTSTRKEDVSLKLRVTNLQNQRGQTQKLEHESKKMEERLRELKMAMSREKEEREAQQAGFWGTGQTGSLGSYAKDVLNKPAKPKGPKTRKVKILKEEPAAPPERNRGPGMMNSIAQRGTSSTGKENKTKGPRCGQCEEKGAQVTCVECGEDYCASCFASFHLRGNLKKHRSVPFGSPGIRTPRGMITPRGSNSNTSVSPKSPPGAQNSHQMAPLRETTLTSEVNPMKVTLTEIDLDMDFNGDDGHGHRNGGPSLLEGEYSEAEAASSFQDALRAWRGETGAAPKQPQRKPQPAATHQREPAATRQREPVVDHGTGMEMRDITPDIKFHGTLTYAEKLLLKQHRRTELQPLPDDLMQYRSGSRSDAGSSSTEPRSRSGYDPELASSSTMLGMPPEPEDTLVEELLDPRRGDDEFRWRAERHLLKSDSAVMDNDRTESRVSIIELDDDQPQGSSRRRQKRVDQTAQYNVTEVNPEEDERLLSSRKNSARGASKPKRAFNSASSKSERTSTKSLDKQPPLTPQNYTPQATSKQKPPATKGARVENTDLSIDLRNSEKGQSSRPKSSARVKSARPKSSRGPSRPQSRAKSRAETRLALFGEGELTKAPSDALREIARMTPRQETTSFLPTMGEFFTFGINLPEEAKEKIITPTKHKVKDTASSETGIPKWKVSYNLYNMGPRSWKPERSLQDNVQDQEAVQTIDETSANVREFLTPSALNEDRLGTVSYSLSGGLTVKESSSLQREVSRLADLSSRPLSGASVTSRSQVATPARSSRLSSSHRLRQSVTPRHEDPDVTPRPTIHEDPDITPRPESRAIVVDGDDYSRFDHHGNNCQEEDEDDDALYQLEWELASQEGRITEDGKMSRLSMMSPDLNDNMETEDYGILSDNGAGFPNSRSSLLQEHGLASPGASLDTRMNALMDDFEEMEQQCNDENDVKALH